MAEEKNRRINLNAPNERNKVRNENEMLRLNVLAHRISLTESEKKDVYNSHDFIMQCKIIACKHGEATSWCENIHKLQWSC